MDPRLIFVVVLVCKETNANCRSIDPQDFSLDYGDFFVPNPQKLESGAGVITSSNYPDLYNSFEQCNFLIEVEPGSRIRIEFTDYNIASQTVLGVFDGLVTPFGGIYNPFPVNTSLIPSPFESNSNFVAINFVAGPDNSTGYRIMYSTVTGPRQNQDQPLLVVDSATSTFFLAVVTVIFIFLSGFIPPV